MKCEDKNCNGEISKKNTTCLQTGCHSSSPAYACEVCGWLHFKRNDGVIGAENGAGEKPYLIDNVIVMK